MPELRQDAHRRLVARLRRQAEDVRRLASGLDEESLARRTISDKWSQKELVCHLGRVQQVFEGRLKAMLAQDNPAIAYYEPEGDSQFEKLVRQPASQSPAGFLADRERLGAELERLSPEQWHRRGGHPQFPDYDVHFQVEYMLHHEAHHIYEMFQRRAPLGKAPH